MADHAATVFLSYASADREQVEPIARALESAGVQTWMDRSDIAGGDFWAAEIANAIQQCALLLVVCSPASMRSRNVRQELQLAWDFDRQIFPLLLEQVSFPPEIAYFLHGRQWIEISAPDWVDQVAAALVSASRRPHIVARLGSDQTAQLSIPGRIPEPATPMIGRRTECAALLEMLERGNVRLVTILGPGGVGKTRLALDVVRALQRKEGCPAAFVDLVPLADAALAPAEIAAALGINDPGQQRLLDTLAARMQGAPWLLFLDNAEHVLEIAPFVGELLQACGSVRILITSRQPLHVRGEREFHLDPLPIPSSDARDRLESLSQSDAVQLFITRVQAFRPEFELTQANAIDVAEICRQLDGLPLAIELAAPRMRTLSPAALRARLQDRLGLLIGGARDAPKRQQALRRTIEWSYDLLDPGQQALLAALAVFEGGFDLDAAEAVAGGDYDVFEGVTTLLDHSLLQRRELRDGEPRFRMLESIRAFGLEQLASAGLEATIRQRHADHFQALGEAVVRRAAERTESDWFANSVAFCDRELDNLRLAWQWSIRTGVPAGALRLLTEVRLFWIVRPHAAEVADALTAGLLAMPDLPMQDRAMAEMLIAGRTGWLGNFDQAFAAAERSLAAAMASGDPALVGRAHIFRGFIWENVGDCEQSMIAYRQAVPWLRQAPDDIYLASALGEQGDRMLICGSIPEGIALLDEAVALDRASHYDDDLAIVLGMRAHGARLQADLPLALVLFQESFELAASFGDNRRALGAVIGIASVAHALGRTELAARLIGAVAAARAARGISRSIAHELHNRMIIADVRASLGETRFAESIAEGRDLPLDPMLARALAELEPLVAGSSLE